MTIAAYCRVSTDREEQLDSLSHQKDFFQTFARKNGYSLHALYADEGISGRGLKNRREFQRMLADAERGLFSMIVVKDISRFARNTVDALTAVRRLRRLGIDVLFLSNNMTVLGQSEFVLTMFSALAQEESANLSARVKFGKRVTGERGRTPTVVYGYRHVDNLHLEVDPEEAAVVREIFSRYTEEGWGCRRIAGELNERGIPGKKGGDWDPRTVRRILENSIYCGDYVNHKYRVADFLEGRVESTSSDERLHHSRPEWAIISEDLFRRTGAEVRRRAAEKGRYSGKYLFSGLIRCGCCGGTLRRKMREGAAFWRCGTHEQGGAASCTGGRSVKEAALIAALARYLEERTGGLSLLAFRAAEQAEAEGLGCREELTARAERFLRLETMTAAELRQLTESITVRDNTVEIRFRPLGE